MRRKVSSPLTRTRTRTRTTAKTGTPLPKKMKGKIPGLLSGPMGGASPTTKSTPLPPKMKGAIPNLLSGGASPAQRRKPKLRTRTQKKVR